MDRRSFLRACGVLGLGAAAGAALPPAAGAVRWDRSRRKVSHTRLLLGTYVTMTALDASQARAEDAMGAAFAEVERLQAVFNRYDSATPLSVLNRDGQLRGAPGELCAVLDRAARLHALSGGAFDATVMPLVDLVKQKAEAGATWAELEIDPALRRALELVDGSAVQVAGDRVRLGRPGMAVTLDGIAKGHIVDRAAAVLSAHGVADHLVNAGGDIRAAGRPGPDRPWTVAVQDPDKTGDFPDVIRLRDGAVATSGSYEVSYGEETLFHHLVDPASGRSPLASRSVTVTAPSVLEADALATAAFVMDPARGRDFVDSLPGRECLILAADGGTLRSRKWGA
jgi:thiamine biosynthesis lipoprotein